ncbi:hypothetical protein [Actinoplanes sp. NPDC051859]|uniref:hypothetical protein n=1 Tax=Actinoplanes sp. NPDC051859 TaxID=3363909 RepID=UPI0037959FAB
MRLRAVWAATALAIAAAPLALPGRATAVEPGFEVRITELPATLGAGAESRTLTVVVSSERGRCQKVRWSLILRSDGPRLDEVDVERVEEGGDFPVQVQRTAGATRITDQQLDPGQLCRGSTVTATYRVSVDDDAATGRLVFAPQAFTARGTLLQEAAGETPVVGQRAEATPTKSASPEPEESDDAEDEAAPAPTKTNDSINGVSASSEGGSPSLLGPGLIVGAVLVFLGVALLLRLRMRNRSAPPGTTPAHLYS